VVGVGVEVEAVACEQADSAGEVRCVQVVALVAAVRCVQVALTGAPLGLSTGSRIQSQIGPTSDGLAGLMSVCLAGLATGPTSDCLADLATGLATDLAGAAVGAEIIGRDMAGVGVQRQ
jgi:hypothetical protein